MSYSTTLLYIFASVLTVSAVSLIGITAFSLRTKTIERILIYLVSFSVGALLGDVFIHLLPEAVENTSALRVGIYILAGIMFSFVIEKFIHWRHCHMPSAKSHVHSFAYMNLVGDGIHNFIDGIIIAGAYFVSIPVGIATTIAVLLHEIPQEIGDFGVLLYAGFTRKKALLYNFFIAMTAIAGAAIGIALSRIESVAVFLIPFAAGNFIYIAGTDLIPELHKGECHTHSTTESITQFAMILLGIAIMAILLLFG